MKRITAIILTMIFMVSAAACGRQLPETTGKTMTTQKEVSRISRFDNVIPPAYEWFNYKEASLAFDALVFDNKEEGVFLPLLWQDETNDTFAFAAYVGDYRYGRDGSEEAVATIASVLSATLSGIDKSGQNDVNYVKQLHAYFSETENIVLNNPGGSSEGSSMWYMLYPAVLFAMTSVSYPDEQQIRQDALACIEKWYEAGNIMLNTGSFSYTGFNFTTMEPWKNGVWEEPDCAAGIAVLMEIGMELTGKAEYEELLEQCLAYLDAYEGSSFYEVLLYFAPALAAKFNAQNNMNYDIDNLLGDVLNGNSIPRGGWGQINGTWGEYCVNGLMGSTTDGDGYAFAMNTFAAGYALAPLAKYDTRYAQAMGIWFLNASAAGRYFFPAETAEKNQSAAGNVQTENFLEIAGNAVPYEGIRKSSNTMTPWVGGDPTVYDWAETDISLYSGAHTGMFAAAVDRTDVDMILKINCNTGYAGDDFATYLLYNPYESSKTVTYELPEGSYDLFDSVEKKIIAENVSGKTSITMEAGQALVLVELPAGSTISHEDSRYEADGKWFASDTVTLTISGYENNEQVTGTVKPDVVVCSTDENLTVEEIILEADGRELVFTGTETVAFDTKDFSEGNKTLKVTVKMSDGRQEQASIRLKFKH